MKNVTTPSLTCPALPMERSPALKICLTALLLAGASTNCAAAAQPVVETEPGERSPTASTSGAPTGSNLDIVVTATRRPARAQEIPISIQSVSAAQLAQSAYKNPTDLQYLSPGVQVSASGGVGFTIRGIGTNSYVPATEQAVGMVIDGVVYGFVDDIGADLSDVERVEILKGPQGTQFGKNASAGVVNIVTERPSTSRLYAVARAAYGSYDDTNLSARVNIPLTGNLATMIVASYQNRDGWVYNPVRDEKAGGNHQYGVKGKVRWNPTPDFDAYLSLDYRHAVSTPDFLSTYRALGIGDGVTPPGFGILDYGITPGPKNTQTGIPSDSFRKTDTGGASLELNYHAGDYTITSISAYRELARDAYKTLGGTPIIYAEGPLKERDNQISQELRITSPVGRLIDFIGGLYYYRRHTHLDQLLAGPFGGFAEFIYGPGAEISFSGGFDHTSYTVNSLAAYIDGSVNLTDKLHLILGARETYDRANSQLRTDPVPNVYPIGTAINGPGAARTSNTDFSWRAGVKYEVTPTVMTYATAARGYKGPLAIAVPGSGARVVDPETVRSYEVGVKTTLLDRHLLFNVSLYYEKFSNFQTSVLDASLVPPAFVLSNAGGLRSKGVEMSVIAEPTSSLTLSVNGAYQDSKFTDFKASCYSAFEPIGLPVTTDPNARQACYTLPGSGVSYIQAAGDPAPNASKWNVTATANYQHPISGTLSVDGTVAYTYRSSFYTNGVDPNTRIPGYGILNANLGIGRTDKSWRIGVFARNLLDKYFVSAIETGIFDDGALTNVINPEAKRTLGVVLDGRF